MEAYVQLVPKAALSVTMPLTARSALPAHISQDQLAFHASIPWLGVKVAATVPLANYAEGGTFSTELHASLAPTPCQPVPYVITQEFV